MIEDLILEYLRHYNYIVDKVYDVTREGHLITYSYKNKYGEWERKYLSVWDIIEYMYFKNKQ